MSDPTEDPPQELPADSPPKDPPEVKEPPAVSDKLLRDHVSDMPPVVEDAVAAAAGKEAERKKIQAEAIDNKGKPFDPAIHAVDADGIPLKTPGGRFKRKLNIPNGAQPGKSTGLPGGPSSPSDPLILEASQYADFFIMTYRGFVGDEAIPEPGERESLIDGWHKFFLKYGTMPMHPIAGLLIFHVAYIGRRAAKPKTKTMLQKMGEGLKGFGVWVWHKAQGKPVPEKK